MTKSIFKQKRIVTLFAFAVVLLASSLLTVYATTSLNGQISITVVGAPLEITGASITGGTCSLGSSNQSVSCSVQSFTVGSSGSLNVTLTLPSSSQDETVTSTFNCATNTLACGSAPPTYTMTSGSSHTFEFTYQAVTTGSGSVLIAFTG